MATIPSTVTPPTRKQSLRKIVIRVLVMAIGIGVAGVLLVATFDDLDLDAIIDALRSLDDAERLSLIGGTVILCWAEGLLMASFVQGMPARRGTLAWLGPTAVGSVVPGPSDVPFIFRMFRSWGQSSASAATAVAAASMFNIASKLILPAIAGIGVVVADIPLDGVMSTIVTAAVILAIFLIVAGIVLGSEKRTAAAGRLLDRVWRPTMRLLQAAPTGSVARRPAGDPPHRGGGVAARLMAQVAWRRSRSSRSCASRCS